MCINQNENIFVQQFLQSKVMITNFNFASNRPEKTWLRPKARTRRKRDEGPTKSSSKKTRQKSSDFEVVQDSSEAIQLQNEKHFHQIFNQSHENFSSGVTFR